MKKILMIALVFNLLALSSRAQSASDQRNDLRFGLKAGVNISNVYDSKTNDFNTDSKLGFAGGGFLTIPINTYLGVQPELLFSQKGFHAAGTFLGRPYELTRTTNYIDVPIFISLKPSPKFTVMAGPQYSYLVKQTDVFSNGLGSVVDQQEFENVDLRKNMLCFIGGFDVDIEPAVVSGRVGWDVQDNNGDGTATIPRYKNVWYQVTLGFEF